MLKHFVGVPILACLLATFPGGGAWAAPPSDAEIAALIRQLGDDRYAERETAQRRLQEIGRYALEALAVATQDEDLEVASRARYLLRSVDWTLDSDPPEVRELLQDYASLSPADRWKRVEKIVELPSGEGYGAVCRLVRHEESPLISKRAAVAYLEHQPFDDTRLALWQEAVEQEIASDASRPACRWLRTCLKFEAQPREAIDALARQAEDEEESWNADGAEDVSSGVVMSLWYRLAEMQRAAGREDDADKTALRARQVRPLVEDDVVGIFEHLNQAYVLRGRGHFDWAEAQYRLLIDTGRIELMSRASMSLSEMQHDQGREREAAETLEQFVTALAEVSELDATTREMAASRINGFRYYYLACFWEEQGDREKVQQFLEKATEADETNLDVLIARHHLPDVSEEFRAETRLLVRQTAQLLQMEMERSQEDPGAYNQYAWLVGNTGGDFQQALDAAQTAVRLAPTTAAYLDTLAHVYYRNGDYDEAVKYQTQAVRYDPHSGLIGRQLVVFREAAKAKREATREKSEAAGP